MIAVRLSVLAAFLAVFAANAATTVQEPPEKTSRGEELKVLSAVGMRQVMIALTPQFEQETGHKLAVTFDSGAVIARNVLAGGTADIVVIPRAAIDDLVRAGAIVPGSVTDIASSVTGLAVRRGSQKPDISSLESFRRTLLNAKSIARPDPAQGGSSGLHIEQVLDRLGIAEQLRSKTILASHPDREQEMPGSFAASGRAEIALHQVQELMAVPGIEVVGALPGDLKGTFLFSAGLLARSARKDAGAQLLALLRAPHTLTLIRNKGMEPAER